jgi:zinc transport system substrate-binding protein
MLTRTSKPIWWALLMTASVIPVVLGCRPTSESEATADLNWPDTPKVIAVCYPLEYLTQRIAGDAIAVDCPVTAGMSAADWRPNREDILNMQQADLVVANGRGAQVAKWLDTVSIPESRLCNSATRGLSLADYIAIEDLRVVHSHGPEGDHSHPTMVANTWLDPAIARKQAAYIAQELTRVFPDHESNFRENLQKLNEDLDRLTSLLPSNSGDSRPLVFTTSPNLKFITRAAGLDDRHMFWNHPPEFGQAEQYIKRLLTNGDQPLANAGGKKMILLSTIPVEGKLSGLLEENKLQAIEIDPLNVRPPSGDYLSVMAENLNRLSVVYPAQQSVD